MKTTLQEKLDFIDSEIRKIHKLCTQSGYTASEIESFAKPFFERDGHPLSRTLWVSGKAWKRRAIALTVLAVSVFLLFRFDPVYNLACCLAKLGAIQILPLWDWTRIHFSSCLIDNPLYNSTAGFPPQHCEICETSEGIIRAREVSFKQMLRYYSKNLILIVEDGARDATNMSLQQLSQMYIHHPVLKNYYSCDFASNIVTRNEDHIELFEMFENGELDRFYARWRNCNPKAVRAFRKFYTRPFFLHRTFGIMLSSWLYISANYTSKIFKPVRCNEQLLVFMQMKGESIVRFHAKNPCVEICPVFEDILHQGEILAVPSIMWSMEYLPSSSPENIAIALEAEYE